MKKLAKEYYWELAQFCMDYHSGQWSRGYRILCKLKVENWSDFRSEKLRDTVAYRWLVDNYADKI